MQGSGGRLAVKEKSAAPIQITAEQLLRESAALQRDEARPPARRLVDDDELNEYRVRKRKQYEDQLRRKRHAMGIWLQYAVWEAEQKDFRRARSVFERALEIDYENISLWNKYLDMETKNQFVNSARNLYDRITSLMPRVDHFWLRYVNFEETLGNYAGARAVYERWMEWEPEDRAWLAYVRFEQRCNEPLRARRVLERFLVVHPTERSFIKFAKFEEEQRDFTLARAAFERAAQILPPEELTETYYLRFAQFEERRKSPARAKQVYLEGLKRLGRQAEVLEQAYLAFQKRCGSREEIEDALALKRRQEYEEAIEKTRGYDYDVWMDYLHLEESLGNKDRCRAVFERAVAHKPPTLQKADWKRYFYLWLGFCIWEELEGKDVEASRKLWQRLMQLIPHEEFSFAKFWIQYANFEVRQRNLDNARKVFGTALGRYPADKIIKAYIDLELKLGNLDRSRKIAAKYIELSPNDYRSWMALIDLELFAGEHARARHLFETAISQDEIDGAEIIWKAYIDMEANLGNLNVCRGLFERLILKTQHPRTLAALAEFEWKVVHSFETAREAYEKGITLCKERELDEERAQLIEAWLKMEQACGDPKRIAKLKAMRPKKVKKRRSVTLSDGTTEAIEDFTIYLFGDDPSTSSSAALLAAARQYKKKKTEAVA
eukprot:Blabericola_migrator_1__1679@NODE_1450_length_4520_cov_82_298226_g959_i0_p2_GENE_NODE_1450_length_4520_cov_82_298226_g959_i0NODE_1450_length_4520_cov_82_298226_g959_i0_p2_ORF_typecomplete_len663_score135_96Suf/PF05843_14/7_3e17Suf/PF05843_14/1_6e06Suf/PF05843_14/5_1e07Suf/PF05843_14/8_3e06Suf/PF05843_14/3_6e13Suf/PF05843_14/9_5e06Suf/PF05843_14/1_6e06TPR_15/PF13429_6/1_3e08TPR_15/PF13429_6/30TPR_15/PF13429_6/0_00052TPR_15/PF13429_6/0_014TPR_15/PF13429_6/2_5e11TPR_15/PF13429_6/41HAT/PF02184_16/8_